MGLTFFRDFPNLTLDLRDLTVVGVDRFEGDTIAAVDSLRFALDVGSVIQSLRGRGPVLVRSIHLDEPALHHRLLDDGTASWDIAVHPHHSDLIGIIRHETERPRGFGATEPLDIPSRMGSP